MRRLAALSLFTLGCDDPLDGPVGGVVLLIRGVPSEPDSRFAHIDGVEIGYDRVEALVGDRRVVVDAQPRTVTVPNAAQDVVVAQLQVPPGELTQLRLFPTAVTLRFADGSSAVLDPETADLPGWRNTGLKIHSDDGVPFPVVVDELTGVRALLDFDDRFVERGNGGRWKMKPTLPAEGFDPNPGRTTGGPFLDRISVVVRAGADPADVQALHNEIGATVLYSAPATGWTRVKLPVTVTLADARDHYRAHPDLIAHAIVALSFGQEQLDTDDDQGNEANLDLARVREAWEEAQERTGDVGDMRVVVAVIDGEFFDVAHPDIYQNIYVNQGEIPACLRTVLTDCDPPGALDGLITIRDLECDVNAPFRPADRQPNGRVDAADLVMPVLPDQDCVRDADGNVVGWAGGGWADGVDDDPNPADGDAVFVDDIAGWEFYNGTNDPLGPAGEPIAIDPHGTAVCGIIGAVGDNGQGVAGGAWRVSLLPLSAASTSIALTLVDDVNLSAALAYVEARGVDVINLSQGWAFTAKGVEPRCSAEHDTTAGIDPVVFSIENARITSAYASMLPAGTNALYVSSAGDAAHYLDDDGIVHYPTEGLLPAIPDELIVVGTAQLRTLARPLANYGADTVEIWAAGVGWTLLWNGRDVQDTPGSGGSFSAAQVSGAAALLASVTPGFRRNGDSLKTALLASATRELTVLCPVSPPVFNADQPVLDARALLDEVP